VKRVLLTGMSGVGKSTVVAELARRGYRAIDLDCDEWSEWVEMAGDDGVEPGRDWVWRADRVRELLSADGEGVLFVSGTSVNQGTFYPLLDHVILLSAPTLVIVERLATRTTNDYGKAPDELARVLGHIETVEPLLRRGASAEVDTSAPVDEVVEVVLQLTRG
jgi:shikimate kinase